MAARLPWPVVIDALEQVLPAAFGPDGVFIDRTRVAAAGGELLLMPAAGENLVGIKLVGSGHANEQYGLPRIQALYVAFDSTTLTPVAVLDGTTLTTRRTAGQSAMVVRRLSDPAAHRLVVFGTGTQARAHVRALATVRPLDSVRIVGRRPEAVSAVCEELSAELGIEVEPGRAGDVATADLVACTTSASEPVFDGNDLPERAFVVAVGSHTPDARELDDATLARAGLVLVEQRQAALREAGDMIQAAASGAIDVRNVRDLGDLVSGAVRPGDGITVFKSVGMGYQDLAVVAAALASR